MSSDESSAESSIPSSPLRPPSPPIHTPAKRRKYRRMYEEQVSSPKDPPGDTTEFIGGSVSPQCLEAVQSYCSKSSSSSQTSSDEECSDTSVGRDDSARSDNSVISDNSIENDASVYSPNEEVCGAQKLFRGSTKTTDEAVLALMDLFIKKRWKVDTVKSVLHFCQDFFPNNMPKSVFKLFKYIESYAPDNYSEISHFYCSDCLTLKEEKNTQCQECKSDFTGVFYELPLAIQINHFFEHRNLAALIDSHLSQTCDDENIISDITSSKAYKDLKITVNGKYDLTLIFNTDGVSPVNSSEAHLYPLMAMICELPPNLRASFMIICGVWYDTKFAPNMNDFLRPFVNSLTEIYEESIVWTHPTTKEECKSVVIAPCLSADALARADILHMQHHNGKYGCNNCEQKTKRFKPSDGRKKMRRYLFQENPALLRSQERMDEQGHQAARVEVPVKGVLGEAVVSKIPHFDGGTSAVPEYMHCVLLGVVKQFLKLWFKTPGNWNIKAKIVDIDKFIKSVKVTDQFVRIPKGINDLALWKASDLRVWLLFICLPALYGHLKEEYFQHFMLLVSAIYLLLKQKITASDILTAETKLRIFVRDIAKLYRLEDYTYNVHNLLHLTQHVERWGPLWATSGFPFENFNHILGELAPGTKHKGQQIVNKIKLAHGVEVLRNKVSEERNVYLVREVVLSNPGETDLDLTIYDLPCDTKGYLRANVKGEIFTTQTYDLKVVRANSYVSFRTGNSIAYGQILYFYEKDSEVNCLIRIFTIDQRKIFSQREGKFSILHLIPFSETNSIISTSVMSLLMEHAKVGTFLCIRPNTIEKNM